MAYKLVETCGACPEAYDVFHEDDMETCVGYLHLRNGFFRVECQGQTVYTAYPKGDGIFEWEERDFYLNKAVDAIDKCLQENADLKKNWSFG